MRWENRVLREEREIPVRSGNRGDAVAAFLRSS